MFPRSMSTTKAKQIDSDLLQFVSEFGIDLQPRIPMLYKSQPIKEGKSATAPGRFWVLSHPLLYRDCGSSRPIRLV